MKICIIKRLKSYSCLAGPTLTILQSIWILFGVNVCLFFLYGSLILLRRNYVMFLWFLFCYLGSSVEIRLCNFGFAVLSSVRIIDSNLVSSSNQSYFSSDEKVPAIWTPQLNHYMKLHSTVNLRTNSIDALNKFILTLNAGYPKRRSLDSSSFRFSINS